MTFDEWCDSKYIKGNWRESLYHHIMATRSGEDLNKEEEWIKAWNELLHHIYSSMPKSF